MKAQNGTKPSYEVRHSNGIGGFDSLLYPRAIWFAIWACLCMPTLVGCVSPHPDHGAGTTSSVPTSQATTRPATAFTFSGYYWVRSPADALRLEREIAVLKLGDTYEDVIKRLGTPDSEWQADATHLFDRFHRHWGIRYNFALVDRLGSTIWDQSVSLYFNSRGRLELIGSNDYAGVKDREAADVWDEKNAPEWWKLRIRSTTFPSK